MIVAGIMKSSVTPSFESKPITLSPIPFVAENAGTLQRTLQQQLCEAEPTPVHFIPSLFPCELTPWRPVSPLLPLPLSPDRAVVELRQAFTPRQQVALHQRAPDGDRGTHQGNDSVK